MYPGVMQESRRCDALALRIITMHTPESKAQVEPSERSGTFASKGKPFSVVGGRIHHRKSVSCHAALSITTSSFVQ